MLFQSLVPTVYVSVARPRCVNSRLESGELAPVHGTPHEPARGPTHHASDSVLREVLRRHLRVQVRDRARRGANPTVHVCPGFRACASKVVLPRARKMGVSPRRAPASPSRRFRGSRAMNAMGTSVWVLVKRLAPEIGVRIDRDAPIRRFPRAHPDRFRATHTDPCFHTEKFSQLTARPPASSVSPRVTGTSSSLPTSPSSYPRVAFSPRYVSDPRTKVEVSHARRFPAGVRRRDSTIATLRVRSREQRLDASGGFSKPSRPSLPATRVRRDDPHTPDP